MMDKQFKEFAIREVFEIKKVYGQPISSYKKGRIPYITGTGENNGVVGYVDAPKEAVSKGNCIAVDPIKGFAYYQPNDCVGRGFSGASVNLLYNENLNEKNALYVCAAIEKVSKEKAAYTCLFNSNRLADAKIYLPVTGDKIDWGYMQDRIAELEQDRIAELEAYIQATGLTEYILSDKDKETLTKTLEAPGLTKSQLWEKIAAFGTECPQSVRGGVIPEKEFLLRDIATLDYGNKFDKNKMTHSNPTVLFVSRTAQNNGISDMVDAISNVAPYPAGSLTLAFGGSIGSCFIQDSPFYTGQNVGVIQPPDCVTEEGKLYFSAVLQKTCKAKFVAFSDEINKHFKTDLSVKLPATEEGAPDWNYMHNYILSLERARIMELDTQIAKEHAAYLCAANADDYILTENDKAHFHSLLQSVPTAKQSLRHAAASLE